MYGLQKKPLTFRFIISNAGKKVFLSNMALFRIHRLYKSELRSESNLIGACRESANKSRIKNIDGPTTKHPHPYTNEIAFGVLIRALKRLPKELT